MLTKRCKFAIINYSVVTKEKLWIKKHRNGGIKMDTIQGKHFSITDPEGVKTVIYEINETEKEYLEDSPKHTVERLEYTEELVGKLTRKTFYVDKPKKEGNQLVILSFGEDKVVINNGILDDDKVKISKKPMPYKFQTIYAEEKREYKDVNYTPNLKRPISIIDPETAEEIKPTLYFDEKTNEVKGKCKLAPYKSYFVFEIREEDGRINLVGGTPRITD